VCNTSHHEIFFLALLVCKSLRTCQLFRLLNWQNVMNYSLYTNNQKKLLLGFMWERIPLILKRGFENIFILTQREKCTGVFCTCNHVSTLPIYVNNLYGNILVVVGVRIINLLNSIQLN